MKKRNIYQNQSQEIVHLFEDAGSNDKIMCVPMDYAKNDHLVMFCNGHGDILRKPFSVKNTPEGIAYIDDQVMRSCRRAMRKYKKLRRRRRKAFYFLGRIAKQMPYLFAHWRLVRQTAGR